MATDLNDFVGSLRREITPPGDATTFANVPDAELGRYLTDAFWEAKLDGFMLQYVCDEDGVAQDGQGGDLPRSDVALCVLYAGIKMLRNQQINTKVSFRAKAGPVEFEQQSSAMVIVEMLRELRAVKDRILDYNGATNVVILDSFSEHLFNPYLETGMPFALGGMS